MGFTELLFSAQGRAPRLPSLIAAVALVSLAAFYEALVGSALHWITGWVVYPALFYPGACVLSKRLHDRGRSGWWAALILASVVAVWPHPETFLDFLFFLVLIWAFVELAVMPGEQGANRYGLNPVALAVV
ncbi:MAG: DUF805 domain-containing protein [Alphaproteobacteria bacterium]|nr:DUF805 domain-containing protein [Alphaproteobacteria bacterium]MBU1512660.1 DUF805 domain-containing protein [Alphaproteobacteria bacterium]MBU2095054.1 DUF805 domain-containing protein [Alphaproteobacteria bacterium]MBU2151827.1 DUF805 domain-containing protein [Alphaproteobacteria bacterium]MBU2306226.1 DUF805 domain-containing protein [Alphaproteobacteria bacterium]